MTSRSETIDQNGDDPPVDPRVRFTARTAAAIPPTPDGRNAHDVGALLLPVTVAQTAKGGLVNFIAPSVVHLSIELALQASAQAKVLRSQITFSPSATPWGTADSVDMESTSILYDYFQQCMVCVTFSYQAIETYANQVIGHLSKAPVQVERRKQKVMLCPEEQEHAATSEKLSVILPAVLGRPSPKGKLEWTKYDALRKTRNDLIHAKSVDSAPRIKQPSDLSKPTLLSRFLDADSGDWVRAAARMIDYFAVPEIPTDWLPEIKDQLNIQDRPARTTTSAPVQLPRGQRRSTPQGSSRS